MHGTSSLRAPAGYVIPIAASYLHAGNHFRKLGSTVKIDAAQDISRENFTDSRSESANR